MLTPRFGSLFWKLFVALWLAMMVAFAIAFGYVRVLGLAPPRPEGHAYLRLIPLISAALVSPLFSALIAWYLSRPLRHLRWGLRRAADEHFDARIEPLMGARRDEITDLAIEFDRMAASLQQLTRTRRTLLHDLSHELRSPLARMQVAVGLGRQNPADAARLADRIEKEIEQLDALVEELLTLHRLESADDAGQAPAKASVDLVELLAAITDDASFESSASGGSVVLTSDGPFIARVNGELVYRAFENVIRNAVRYSAPGTVVEVQATTLSVLKQSGAALRVEVRDRGPGVPGDKLAVMFEPFVRLEGHAGTRGTGLGLAIARRAIVSHGGRIEASLRDGGGLVMRIEIPSTGAPASPPA